MENNDRKTIDLFALVDNLWKGFKKFSVVFPVLIVLCSTCCFAFQFFRYRPVYRAYTSFAINAQTSNGYSTTIYNKTIAQQLGKTFPYILTSGALQQIVAEDLGYENGVLPGTITATSIPDNALFTITVTASDPEVAYNILQSVVTNYPSVAEYIIGKTELEIIDESGIPEKPSNRTGYKRAVFNGALFGTGISFMILLIYALTRNTVRSEEDLKKSTSLTFLGALPHVNERKRTKQENSLVLFGKGSQNAELGEALRTIRSRVIKETRNSDLKSILVTSASAEEGKTTFSINLAVSLAKHGSKVILVDADLRNPSVGKALGMKSQYGIKDVLSGKVSLLDALETNSEYGIRVLEGQKVEKNITQLYNSKQMTKLIEECERLADYVIVDTAPCGFLSDAGSLARKMDAVIFVVRQDYTRIDRILESIEKISETNVHILGYVINDAQLGITGRGYGYGYGYGYKYSYGYGYRKHYGEQEE